MRVPGTWSSVENVCVYQVPGTLRSSPYLDRTRLREWNYQKSSTGSVHLPRRLYVYYYDSQSTWSIAWLLAATGTRMKQSAPRVFRERCQFVATPRMRSLSFTSSIIVLAAIC